MAIRHKEYLSDRIYFITFSVFKWQKIFISKKYIDLVYKWFDYIKNHYEIKIHGYVIMPHHLHLLLYFPENSPIISKVIQNGKRFLAYQIIKLLKEDQRVDILNIFSSGAEVKKGAKHKVFQDRYDSKEIDSKNLFIEKINYIHNNPCNKGWMLAEDPVSYKYSSASNYYLGEGIYEVDLIG